jgi:hypothetical protein
MSNIPKVTRWVNDNPIGTQLYLVRFEMYLGFVSIGYGKMANMETAFERRVH